jgi:hypothetical protein
MGSRTKIGQREPGIEGRHWGTWHMVWGFSQAPDFQDIGGMKAIFPRIPGHKAPGKLVLIIYHWDRYT